MTARWPEQPYKGLRYYSADDVLLFAGREQDVERIAARLGHPRVRILIMHGRTGCGKSSFLRAGLIPYLERPEHGFQFLRETDNGETGTSAIFIRSGDGPLARLAEKLFELGGRKFEIQTPLDTRTIDLSAIRLGHARLEAFVDDVSLSGQRMIDCLAVLGRLLPKTLVVVIDQAEEVLTLQSDLLQNDAQSQFFHFLAVFANSRMDLKLMIALRSEFYGDFDSEIRKREPEWQNIQQEQLSALAEPAIASAIEHPTRHEGYEFVYEPKLADRIANDLIKTVPSGGALPVMQVMCERLYKTAKERTPSGLATITAQDYENLGGVEQQLDSYLHDMLNEMCDKFVGESHVEEEIDKWYEILSLMVRQQVDGTSTKQEQTVDRLTERCQELGCDAEFDQAMVFLSDRRILQKTLVRNIKTDEIHTCFTLGHDALGLAIRSWRERGEGRDQGVERFLELQRPYSPPDGDAFPDEFPEYEIMQRLGEGGMGEVFKAIDTQLARNVALKRIRPDKLLERTADTPKARFLAQKRARAFRERFRREAKILARLDHMNIVRVYYAGTRNDDLFIVMQYVEGGSLLEHATSAESLSDALAASYVADVADAIQHAHASKILHRDLNPGNVLLHEGRPMVIDFGLAIEADTESADEAVGTIDWIAPEAVRGVFDERTDIYGLGTILYFLLTGETPTCEGGKAPRPETRRAEVSPDLDRICAKCLSPKPSERYSSAQEVADALRQFVQEEEPGILETEGLLIVYHPLDEAHAKEVAQLLNSLGVESDWDDRASRLATTEERIRFVKRRLPKARVCVAIYSAWVSAGAVVSAAQAAGKFNKCVVYDLSRSQRPHALESCEWVERDEENADREFEKKVRDKIARSSSIVKNWKSLLAALVTPPIVAAVYAYFNWQSSSNGGSLPVDQRRLAYVCNLLVVVGAYVWALVSQKQIRPEDSAPLPREVVVPVRQMRSAWKALWVLWCLLYAALLGGLAEPSPGLSLVADYMNLFSSLAFVYMFLVLNSPSVATIRAPHRADQFISHLRFACVVCGLVMAVCVIARALGNHQLANIINGATAGIAMALFFGRFDSDFFRAENTRGGTGARRLLDLVPRRFFPLGLFYCYVMLQLAFFAFDYTDIAGALVAYAAAVLKILVLLTLHWRIFSGLRNRRGSLEYYFRHANTCHELIRTGKEPETWGPRTVRA